MKLSYISISNYRSITDAYKINLSNQTILLGKNNEGKTNIIRAINLGMTILHDISTYSKKRIISKQLYDWHDDFPISLQKSKRLKNKDTVIRFDFQLNDDETSDFSNKIHSNINGALSIYIKIGMDNGLSVTVPKRGKNAKAISHKIYEIGNLICERFYIQYIPAVRSESDAYKAISELIDTELSSISDQLYLDSLEYIEKIQQEKLKELSNKVRKPLKSFLPNIKSVNLSVSERLGGYNYMSRKLINIEIDDGVLTNLSNKGDGVKSLATIALLSQISSNKDRLIIVDEPENHLHSGAIHYIDGVLRDLAKENQVLVSTHNSVFVNRNDIHSNLIVDSGKVQKADKIDSIRRTLGVICSDNLIFADYVIIVEGPTDRDLLVKLFNEDRVLRDILESKRISIRSIGGVNNLKSEIYALQRYCCNYIVLLDGDSAGKSAAALIKQTLSVSNDKIRYFMRGTRGESEIEDLYNPEIYKDYLNENGIDISNGMFKNVTKKWSERLKDIAATTGKEISKEEEDDYKKHVVELIHSPIQDCLTEIGQSLLKSIIEKIKSDLKAMSLII